MQTHTTVPSWQTLSAQAVGWEVIHSTKESAKTLYRKDMYDAVTNPSGTFKPKVRSKETNYAEQLILGPRHV